MRSLPAATIVLATAATASAQPSETPPARTKSPTKALALSAGGTAAGAAVVVAGFAINQTSYEPAARYGGEGLALAGAATMLVAPSFGHLYADDVWTTGLKLRAGGLVAMGTGIALFATDHAMTSQECAGDQIGHCNLVPAGIKLGVAALGLVAVGVGAGMDIATAPRAARRWNEQHALSFTVAPTVMPTRDGTVAGLGVAGTF
jgi:hypothetical protein